MKKNKLLLIPALCVICFSCNGNSKPKTYSNDYTNGNTNNYPNGNSSGYSNGNNQMQSQYSDSDITANVKKNLMSDNSLSPGARMILVTTNNGVVTLTGTAANMDESRRVVTMVNNVPGVRSVNNQLTTLNP